MGDGFKIVVGDNFFHSGEWDDLSKELYREWLSRQSEDHPAKKSPEPWNESSPYGQLPNENAAGGEPAA